MEPKFWMALAASLAFATPASANIVYMTGTSNPWGNTTNDSAMDAAFGAGNWTKVMGFDVSALTGTSFIFIDGGDSNADQFGDFLIANFAAFEAFLAGGGRALVHAAPNRDTYANYVLPLGLTLDGIAGFTYPTASNVADLTAAGIAAGLGASGAGSSFTGSYFSHNAVFGGTCLITGSAGCITARSGNLMAGGETITFFHSGDDPFQLRVNELRLASAGGGVIPEPGTWAMLIAGFGVVGAGLRRRRSAVAAA
jgi:hypothetical protein